MANDRIIQTVPGFTLQSPNFKLQFISAYDDGVVSESFQYETDWMETMVIILYTLEYFPTSVEFAEKYLVTTFERMMPEMKVTVKLRDRAYFGSPFGKTKKMTLEFNDGSSTNLIFLIKKRTIMTSLKDIAAEAVVNKLKTEGDIAKLDIPLSLKDNLVKEYQHDWNERYYRSNAQ